MGNLAKSFKESFRVLKSDKWIIVFGSIPVLLGCIIYYFLGLWLYSDVLGKGKAWIETTLSSGNWGTVVYYIMMVLLTVVMYFVVSWTFVLIVSIIASPFNDLLSSRVEKAVLGEAPEGVADSFGKTIKKMFFTILNEIKKVSVIAIVSIVAFAISFIPLLVPVSIALSGILLAANFLDYSWSRHDISMRGCLSGLRRSWFEYTIAGVVFMSVLSIPFVNVLCLPFAVIFFTVLFTHKRSEVIEQKINY